MQRVENHFDHPFLVPQHFVVPESQDAKSLCFEPRGTNLIIALRFGMRGPIELDDEPFSEANEIGDVTVDRLLAAETESLELPAPQEAPESPFCIGHMLTQLAGGSRDRGVRHG
jgi:hypothetical protein